jgi:hypothetical protein
MVPQVWVKSSTRISSLQNHPAKGKVGPSARSTGVCIFVVSKTPAYLFEYWNLFRAFICPYFFLSTMRGSLVKSPSFFRIFLKSSFIFRRALAIPNLIAPACPERPPPLAVQITSSFPNMPVKSKGFCTKVIKLSLVRYSRIGRPLTIIFPAPKHRRTFATAVFLLPVA